MNINEKKKIYHSYDPERGYPAGSNLYYECLKCGDIVPSLPIDNIFCSCRNIAIDVDYGRISIKDHSLIKLFSIEE